MDAGFDSTRVPVETHTSRLAFAQSRFAPGFVARTFLLTHFVRSQKSAPKTPLLLFRARIRHRAVGGRSEGHTVFREHAARVFRFLPIPTFASICQFVVAQVH